MKGSAAITSNHLALPHLLDLERVRQFLRGFGVANRRFFNDVLVLYLLFVITVIALLRRTHRSALAHLPQEIMSRFMVLLHLFLLLLAALPAQGSPAIQSNAQKRRAQHEQQNCEQQSFRDLTHLGMRDRLGQADSDDA